MAWISTPKTNRSSISHQHVLAPEDRSIDGSAPIRDLEDKINALSVGSPASPLEGWLKLAPGSGWLLIYAFVIAVLEISSGAGFYISLRILMSGPAPPPDPEPPSHWEVVPRPPEPRNAGRKASTRGKSRSGDHDNGARL